MSDTGLWLPPLLVGSGLTAIGWLVRNAVGNITGKIDDLDASFARITADLVVEHRAMEERIDNMNMRLVRVESWKEILSLPGPSGEVRRITDRMQDRE